MSKLLEQLDDENMDFTVTLTDTDGVTGNYEFLDIVCRDKAEYAVLAELDSDGFVDIFKIQYINGDELYVREKNEKILDEVFALFKIKNEDEFDFDE